MRSYYFKNYLLVAGLVMLSFIILGAAFVGMGRNYMLRERRSELDSNALELSRLAAAYARDGDLDSWEFRITLSAVAESSGTHCFLTDAEGRVLVCSDRMLSCGHVGENVGESALEALRAGSGFNALSRMDGFYDEARYVSALPVRDLDGTALAYAFASADVSGVLQTWSNLLNIFFVTSLSIMVLLLILSYVSVRLSARPFNEMAAAALKFAHGDFSARVDAERDDELGALADAFNQMAESLEQQERRRSDFIANVAHELKTPMTTIAGFADGILDGTIPREQEDQYLQTISSETKRLNRLVRSMLDLSRMQSEGPEALRSRSFELCELLVRTLLLFEQKINAKRLDVDALIPEEAMQVYGDADAINQVIYNLLENSVKFAEPGSVLGVSAFKQGEKAYVSIKNRGATIPAEELPLIFERFHKTDKSRSEDRDGYGLGLYIVKTILNNHGEDIAVTSRDGVTEFLFSLTLKKEK